MSITYKGISISSLGDLETLNLIDFTEPELKEGEVLIKMECSTINPVDLLIAYGQFGPPVQPSILGLEGSGTVVKSGGGAHADSLLNKRVAVMHKGTWNEYMVAPAHSVYAIRDSISFEKAASLIVNPFTVGAIVEKIHEGNHKAIVMNAAASGLGKIMIRWGHKFGVDIVCLVRRQEQVDTLASLGAKYIINTSTENWKNDAKNICSELKVKIGFDCISGTATNDMIDLLEIGGIVYIYGTMANQPFTFNAAFLMLQLKRVEGLAMPIWLYQKDHEAREKISQFVQDNFEEVFRTEYASEVNLTGLKSALLAYQKSATNNKILVRIHTD
ncbi:hypothetical protein SteCoe_32071 [Stentor coeruleus]|uniref:Enoyl reductase (ER) domain-containing protein n=1 Tax=Stentor coeruleus TaxID=5963 RepID=A0A1R2AZX1_9CILI|nr:hypothetical protein SteCoe_32071 [Stentor coeruleus]